MLFGNGVDQVALRLHVCACRDGGSGESRVQHVRRVGQRAMPAGGDWVAQVAHVTRRLAGLSNSATASIHFYPLLKKGKLAAWLAHSSRLATQMAACLVRERCCHALAIVCYWHPVQVLCVGAVVTRLPLCGNAAVSPRAQKKAEREAMLRSQFEEKRAERVQKYQVGVLFPDYRR